MAPAGRPQIPQGLQLAGQGLNALRPAVRNLSLSFASGIALREPDAFQVSSAAIWRSPGVLSFHLAPGLTVQSKAGASNLRSPALIEAS